MRPISLRGLSLLCVVVITASMKLSGEIFKVRHSPYAVSKFEFGKPSKQGENGWEHLWLYLRKPGIYRKFSKISYWYWLKVHSLVIIVIFLLFFVRLTVQFLWSVKLSWLESVEWEERVKLNRFFCKHWPKLLPKIITWSAIEVQESCLKSFQKSA